MKKTGSVLRFGALILGLCFFWNPNIHIIDILPDCIGALLILWAISRLADLSGALADAKRAFTWLFWVTLSKLPALVLMLWVLSVNVGERVSALVFAFCYAIAETLLGIRAFRLLFDGLGELGMQEADGEFLYLLPEKHGKIRRTSRLLALTAVFFIVKFTASVLPELVYLSSYDTVGFITARSQAMTRFYPLLVVFAALPVTVFGIVWLCKMLGFVRHLRARPDFWERLNVRYAETVAPKAGLFAYRRICVFSALCSVAMAFAVDMYFDEINVLPDFFAALFFFLAAFFVQKDAPAAKWLKWLALPYGAAGVVTFVTMLRFTGKFTYRAVLNPLREGAKELYAHYAIANAVEQVLFVCTMLALCAVIRQLVAGHTGVQTLTGTSSSRRPLGIVYNRRTVRTVVLSVLSAAMSTLYFWFVIDVRPIDTAGGYVYFPRFEVAWIVDFTIALILCVQTANLLYDLCGEVRYRYMFE